MQTPDSVLITMIQGVTYVLEFEFIDSEIRQKSQKTIKIGN